MSLIEYLPQWTGHPRLLRSMGVVIDQVCVGEELGSCRVDSHGGGTVCKVCSVHVGAVVAGLSVGLQEERARDLAVNIAFHWHHVVDSHEGLWCAVYCSKSEQFFENNRVSLSKLRGGALSFVSGTEVEAMLLIVLSL